MSNKSSTLGSNTLTDPTPSTPTPKPPKKKNVSTRPATTTTPTSNGLSLYQQNEHAVARNGPLLTPKSAPPVQNRAQVAVEVPSLPSSSQYSEYVGLPDRQLPSDMGRAPQPTQLSTSRVNDGQAEADAALYKFEELLRNIFNAEDGLQSDSSVVSVVDGNSLIVEINVSESTPFALAAATQIKLQNQIPKLVKLERFGDVALDDLIRLQRLCERPLASAQTVSLKLDSDFSESDVDDWLQKVELAQLGLLSAGTLMRIMMAQREEKELRSEENIIAIPNALNNVFENCVVQVVECRSQGRTSDLFAMFSIHKKVLGDLMHRAKNALTLFSKLISKIKIVDEAINTTESLSSKLFFVDNARSEKEAIFGTAKYESVRRCAMDALARIFSKYPDQRDSILTGILNSLDKLPQTQKSARQFKLVHGKDIQLLTVLVMQLVQTITLQVDLFSSGKGRRLQDVNGTADNNEEDDEDDEGNPQMPNGLIATRGANGPADVTKTLASKLDLYEDAVGSAMTVVKFFVHKAMTSTKTGDQPYRNLFDFFTEDLISALDSTDWPAAELILRLLANAMVVILSNAKSTALARNMALEILGIMGAGISDVFASLGQFPSKIDRSSSKISGSLYELIENQQRGAIDIEDVLEPNGPFRVTLEYLRERAVQDWQIASAASFCLIQWAKTVSERLGALGDEEEEESMSRPILEDTASLLVKMLSDPNWIDADSEFDSASTIEGRAAYNVIISNLDFCRAYDTIVKVLVNCLTDDQTKIRNRSLKSVLTILEKDKNLINRQPDIMKVIFRSASDNSPLVRDSALSLIGKCVHLKPELQSEACGEIKRHLDDAAVGVRKRCIGLLKEMYSRDAQMGVKADIAESLLLRMKDVEDSICELARQMLEDAWFIQYTQVVDTANETPQAQVEFKEHVSLIVRCIQRGPSVVKAAVVSCFELFLGRILAGTSKNASANAKVGKRLVATMFGALVDPEFPAKPSDKDILDTITIFAKADAKLISPDHIQDLQPFLSNLKPGEDASRFRSAVIILRCVLPSLSAAQSQLLEEVHQNLVKTWSKLPRAVLNEVMACLWTIGSVLQNTKRLARMAGSILDHLDQSKGKNKSDPKALEVYVKIAGSIGKYWDLENASAQIKSNGALSQWNGGSVSQLMVDLILPFISSSKPSTLRTMSLESLVNICQSWPAQFLRDDVLKILDSIFAEDNAVLENTILKTFAEFFTINEGKREKVANFDGTTDTANDSGFGASMKASDRDGAVAKISQHFLKKIVYICLHRQDDKGLTAILVVASISRQGLVHPKECAGVWVACETSKNQEIANIAFETHKKLHQQHESMFEREYMRAVRESYIYQRDVVGDSSGATNAPNALYRSKLSPLFEIVKISNSKYQKKFLWNICAKINFEPEKLDCSGELPDQLLYARFLIQNLAFFEYGRMEELMDAISSMEKVVHQTGANIANSIDIDLSHTTVGLDQPEGVLQPSIAKAPVEPQRLRQLTISSMILSMLWEARTFLRRLYGISSGNQHREKKNQTKDPNKAPTKVHSVSGDRFMESLSRIMGALTSEETMETQCKQFSQLLSIDDELKVGDELDDDRESRESGSVDLENGTPMSGASKRKGSVSASGTPKKARKRGRPSLGNRRRSRSKGFDDDADGWD